MKYKELLDLYKNGRLSEEESKKLEAEIEKQEAISEYLYPDEEDEEYDKEISETEDRGFTREGGKTSAKEDEFVMLIRKSIRKAFIKMGAVVTAAVLVIILLMITILPKAVDLLYYNPCAAGNYSEPEGVGGYGERFGLDLSIYTELTAPFNYLDSAEVVSEGYGNYSFSAYKSEIRNGETREKYAGNIRKNRITFYDPMALESRADNMFEWQINNNDYNESLTKQLEKFRLKQLKTKENAEKRPGNLRLALSLGGDRNESKERIDELSDNRLYRAYITFDKILSYKEAIDFETKYELGNSWVGIVNDVNGNNDILGMNTGIWATSGNSLPKYPYLLGYEGNGEAVTFKELKNEENAKKHYLSLINYLKDNVAFTDMMDNYMDRKTELYRALSYVNENGLKVYGMAVKVEKQDLVKLIEDERVFGIGIEEE